MGRKSPERLGSGLWVTVGPPPESDPPLLAYSADSAPGGDRAGHNESILTEIGEPLRSLLPLAAWAHPDLPPVLALAGD
ncbi:Mycothiol acetyltransferase, partial [Clarias magur]